MDRGEKILAEMNAGLEKGEKIELVVIEPLIRTCWLVADTASPGCQGSWTKENPSFGHCAVTALLVQDLEGGDLLRTVVPGFGSHYYNRLSSGQEVDLTRGQFPTGTEIPPGEVVGRDYVLNSERAKQARTPERYEKFKDRFLRIALMTLIGIKVREQK